MPTTPPATERAGAHFRTQWGASELISRAPGRVNLIGEHTDYNDGFTLPMALPFDTAVAFATWGDPAHGPVEVQSAAFGAVTVDPTDPQAGIPGWAIHIAGVVGLMSEVGVPSGGWRAVIDTDIPVGASLSSSAALEVALIKALLARAAVEWEPIDIARLGQRVENEIVGLPSGIMDQFISAGAVAGHASLMDCRALTLTPAPLPADVVVAVMDTGTRRVLAEAAYADRRASCERVANELGVPSLRDATLSDLAAVSDDTDRRRAHHVIAENERTLSAVAALSAGDAAEFGRLMDASHVSLRDDFEVSGPGLDRIVDIAGQAPGVLGARMTGGGFAGCAVALVANDEAAAFAETVRDRYDYDGHRATVWLCEPSAGASVLTA